MLSPTKEEEGTSAPTVFQLINSKEIREIDKHDCNTGATTISDRKISRQNSKRNRVMASEHLPPERVPISRENSNFTGRHLAGITLTDFSQLQPQWGVVLISGSRIPRVQKDTLPLCGLVRNTQQPSSQERTLHGVTGQYFLNTQAGLHGWDPDRMLGQHKDIRGSLGKIENTASSE